MLDQLLISMGVSLTHLVPLELILYSLAAATPKPFPQLSISEQPADRGCQSAGIVSLDENPVRAVLDDLGDAEYCRRHDWLAARERLDDGDAEALISRGEDE
jgi:hypothetical protein